MCSDVTRSRQQRVIVVLGMHRSGTSAITKGLETLGVRLGDHYVSANSENPRGYWEDEDIVALDSLLLRRLGLEWDGLVILPGDWWRIGEFSRLKAQANRLLSEKLSGGGDFGFKDPRALRLLPFWLDLLDERSENAHYVYCVRDPLSVAESIRARDGLTIFEGGLLWLLHVVPDFRKLRGRSVALVHFDQLLEDPENALRRIGERIGAGEIKRYALDQYANEFLSRDLRHASHTVAELSAHAEILPLCVRAYKSLCDACNHPETLGTDAFWDAWTTVETDFRALGPLLAAIDRWRHAWQPSRTVSRVYFDLAEAGFVEEHSVATAVFLDENGTDCEIRIPPQGGAISRLRVDLSEQPTWLFLRAIELNTGDGRQLWQWSGDWSELAPFAAGLEDYSLVDHGGVALHACTHDAQIALPVPALVLRQDSKGLAVRITMGTLSPASIWQHLARLGKLKGKAESERDAAQAEKDAAQAEKDAALQCFEVAAATHRDHVATLEAVAAEKRLAVEERERQLALSQQELAATQKQLVDTHWHLSETQQRLNATYLRLADTQQQLVQTQDELGSQRQQLVLIFASWSWRLTAPLRRAMRGSRSAVAMLRRTALSLAKGLWRAMPIGLAQRYRIKRAVLSRFGVIFRRTASYRDWYAVKPAIVEAPPSLAGDLLSPPEEEYVAYRNYEPLPEPPVRLLAFYLPQFHPIPENDAWWGKGFTEWANVTRAAPQYSGHYQPRMAGELGYYDLRLHESHRRQIELAKNYGVAGFCYYFYWFGGKRLLELPLLNHLQQSDMDFPFCLCWANENWSRRWDGKANEILIGQQHSAEDDFAFIAYVAQYLRDPRYIKVNGRPLLLVYRPGLLPSPKATARRWRDWCRENGIGEIHIAYIQSFESAHPADFGFDAAVEFPPNNTSPPLITDQVSELCPGFSGAIYDWTVFPARSRDYAAPGYPLYRGVCPSWDNTARRMDKATVFHGASPQGYAEWLENAAMETLRRSRDPGERLVFVNAWNEWAEGAYLEPDRRYGYAYLQATRDALETVMADVPERQLVLVSHDAHPHGAQFLALHMARVLKTELGVHVEMIVLGGGPLLDEYRRFATVHLIEGSTVASQALATLAQRLFARGSRFAICNTTASGMTVVPLKTAGFRVMALIHELPGVIERHGLTEHVKLIAAHAESIVFPAAAVREGFSRFAALDMRRVLVRPQGLLKHNSLAGSRAQREARVRLRQRFGLDPAAFVVLSVAYADHRKGVDLFVEIGCEVMARHPEVVFLWVGHFDGSIEEKIQRAVAGSGFESRFVFPGLDIEADVYFAGADIYALTSREDPFPSVVLQSLEVGVPVVGFEKAGGFADLLQEVGGVLVGYEDTGQFSAAIEDLLANPDERVRLGARGRQLIRSQYSLRRYLCDLISADGGPLRRVSVVLPNYNYARYLPERIASIAAQTYPVYELIVLDDASTDGSDKVLEELLADLPFETKLVRNERNSGSVFAQWMKGVALARGDCVWIAEADDWADPRFLEQVIRPFDAAGVVMSYCQSAAVDSEGRMLSPDYQGYLEDVDPERWTRPFLEDGTVEICNAMAIKNTVPNVSAVVFAKDVLNEVLSVIRNELLAKKVSGDWLTYVRVLERGRIAYCPEALNKHRRHEKSVTKELELVTHLREVIAMQHMIADAFPVSAERSLIARTYAQRLYEQFGLSRPAAPNWEANPELTGAQKAVTTEATGTPRS